MKIAITDANIFIDLIHIQLHDELFAAELEIHSTLDVFDELNNRQQNILTKYIKERRLTLHKNDEQNISEEIRKNKKLSPSDKSVFSLARKLNAVILTGDGLLRKISTVEKVEIHGTIWLLDRFVEMKLLARKRAVAQLRLLMKYNKRLPLEDCEKRIVDWS